MNVTIIRSCFNCSSINQFSHDESLVCPSCGSEDLRREAVLVNLTPHQVDILCPDWGTLSVPASGQVARCSQTEEHLGTLGGLIGVTAQAFGEVVDLPDLEFGVTLIVSRLVKAAVPSRTDVFCPGPLVRDTDGKVVGCRGLAV